MRNVRTFTMPLQLLARIDLAARRMATTRTHIVRAALASADRVQWSEWPQERCGRLANRKRKVFLLAGERQALLSLKLSDDEYGKLSHLAAKYVHGNNSLMLRRIVGDQLERFKATA